MSDLNVNVQRIDAEIFHFLYIEAVTNGCWEAATPEKVFTEDAQREGSLSWPLSCPKQKGCMLERTESMAISKKK